METQTNTENSTGTLHQVIISTKLTFGPSLASDDIWPQLPAVTGVAELCYTVLLTQQLALHHAGCCHLLFLSAVLY